MPKRGEVFYTMAQIERRFLPRTYAERLEKEKLVGMTSEEQAHYIGEKLAQETLKRIGEAVKRIGE